MAVILAMAAPAAAAGTHPKTGETLSDDQTFTYRLLDQFPTLDPQLNEDTSGFPCHPRPFRRPAEPGCERQPDPRGGRILAVSDNNKTYTFTLRHDARWSNGDPVTAQDFVYAWRRAADPATASNYGWYLELTEMVCPSSKQMGLLSVFHKGGSGSSLFDVKPLGVDGSSGGFGWSVF